MICPYCKCSFNFRKRSLDQNAYYQGPVIGILAEYCGNSHDEMHEILKQKFLSRLAIVINKNGEKEEIRISRSTADLSTVEFEEYLKRIKTWASSDLSIYIPDPNEQLIKDNH